MKPQRINLYDNEWIVLSVTTTGALLFTNSTALVTDAFRKGRVGLELGINQIAGAAGFLLGPVVERRGTRPSCCLSSLLCWPRWSP